MSDEVLLARALLSRVAEPACVPLWAAVRRDGPVRTVAALRDGHPDADVRRATSARLGTVDPGADLEAAAHHGCRLVVPESDEWPHFALAALEASGRRRVAEYRAGRKALEPTGERVPPLALWVRGHLDLTSLGTRSVGVVGARAMTSYGEHVTKVLAYGLAARGHGIVSGGAHGVDGCAHRAALTAGGDTVIVSAGGLDRAYPPAHQDLFDRVAAHGLLISESPPGAAPHRHRFLTRNRLIAALSSAVLVTEAALRSGALNTAGHAHHLGRPVMAVPGPVTSAMSAGCHRLLGDGDDSRATLVGSVDQALAVLGDDVSTPTGLTGQPGRVPGDALRTRLAALDAEVRQVFDGLPRRGLIGPEQLAMRSGVAVRDVIVALPVLELAGLVRRDRGGYGMATDIR